jgi:acyl carrier protein
MSQVIQVIGETLNLGKRVDGMNSETRLLGSIPEFDSMSIVNIMLTLEERLDTEFDDDDLSAETFETVGTLTAFIRAQNSYGG